MLPLLALAFLVAACAVLWAVVLVDQDMLLAPVQRRLRAWHRARFGSELDDRPWWKPVWGCDRCVAGQWAFWYYLLFYWPAYSPLHHFAFVALTILLAAGLSKYYQWTQS